MTVGGRSSRRVAALLVALLIASLVPVIPTRAIIMPGDPPGTPPPICEEGVPEPCMIQSWLGRFTVSPHVVFEGDLYTLTWDANSGGSMPAWPASGNREYRTEDCPTVADNTAGGTFTCTYRLLVADPTIPLNPGEEYLRWYAITVGIINNVGPAVAQDAQWAWPGSFYSTVRVEDPDGNAVGGPMIDIRLPAHTIYTYEGDTPVSVFNRSGMDLPGVSNRKTIQDLAAANPHLADRFAAGHFFFGQEVHVPETIGTIPFDYRTTTAPWDGSWQTGLLFRTGEYELRARRAPYRESAWVPLQIVNDNTSTVLALRETLEPHSSYTVSENPAPGSRRFASTSTPGATDSPIVEWSWGFGDGTVDVGPNEVVDHQYAEPGIYFTQLTVTAADGLSDTSAREVDARAPELEVTVSADVTDVQIGDIVPVQIDVAASAGGFGALTDLTFVGDALQVFPAERGAASAVSPAPGAPFTLQPGERRTFTGSVEILTGGNIELLSTVTGLDGAGQHITDTHYINGVVTENPLKVTFSGAPCAREEQQPVYRCVVDFAGGDEPAPVDVEVTVEVQNPSAATLVNNVVIDQDLAISAAGQQPLGGRLAETDGPLEAGQPVAGGLIGTLLPGESRSVIYHVRATAPGTFIIEVSVTGDAEAVGGGGGGGEVGFATGAFRTEGPTPVTAAGEMRLAVGDELVVNRDGDAGDADTSDGTCDTDLDGDPDTIECTLRAAIQEANARQAGGRGPQSIVFDIPGGGEPRIAPQSVLPDVEGTTTIDGTTQPGGSVLLYGFLDSGNGSGTLTALPTGFRLTGAGTQLKGLAVQGFVVGVVLAGEGHHSLRELRITGSTDVGVRVESSGNAIGAISPGCATPCNVLVGNGSVAQDDPDYERTGGDVVVASGADNTIAGNAIGWDPQDTQLSSAVGISVRAGAAVHVGPGNVIGKAGVGIVVAGTATISGNHIGIAPDGTPLADWSPGIYGNPKPGIWVSPSGSATIGGSAVADRNVISGWGPRPGHEQPGPVRAAGIIIEGSGAVIRNNWIGTDPAGQAAVANWRGVVIGREGDGAFQDLQVALGTVVEGNVISGNEIGVLSYDTTATIAGNRIGTNPAGTTAVPNGIGIRSAGLVGGARADGETACISPCNLISGNSVAGLAALTAAGNFIGTTLDGTTALPNAIGVIGYSDGSASEDRPEAIVGGPSHATQRVCDLACNLIAFNEVGVAVTSSPSRGPIRLTGNVIADHAASGVRFTSFASGSRIGGSADMDGNLITRNGEAGVAILSGATDISILGNVITDNLGEGVLLGRDFNDPARVTVRTNRISGNGRLGIDLSVAPVNAQADGPTANDFYTDPDAGPNSLQNKPIDGKAMRFTSVIQVLGTFERPPEQLFDTYTIDLFANAACDPSGFGQGERPIGEVTNIGLDGRWEALLSTATAPAFITATITAPNGDTSEFGPCWPVMRAARMSASVSVGATTLPMDETDGFPVGDQVALDPDGPTEEVHTVTGHGSLLLAEPLAFSHPAGTTVLHLGTPPDTTITAGPADDAAIAEPAATFGFESSDPEATFECSLDGADWAACDSPEALAGLLDGPHTFEVRALLADGRFDPSPAARSFTVDTSSTDTTPPTITFIGLRDYGLLETVSVICAFDDGDGTGILASACTVPPPAPGWTFGPGSEAVSSWAIDVAGNKALAEDAFTVSASFDDLCTLTGQFSARKHEKDLCNQLEHADKEAAKGKAKQAAKHLDEYVKKVQKDRKAFTPDEQATLVAFARSI